MAFDRESGISMAYWLNHMALILFLVNTVACAPTYKKVLAKDDDKFSSSAASVGADLITNRHLNNFRMCVIRSKKVDPSSLSRAKMTVEFLISPAGRASSVFVKTHKFRSSTFAGCVERIIYWIRFPPSTYSKSVQLQFQLDEDKPVVAQKIDQTAF